MKFEKNTEELYLMAYSIRWKKEKKILENKYSTMEEDHFTAAKLNPNLIQKVKLLEAELQAETEKEVILIAYEESSHNPT